MSYRSIRGAITVECNNKEEILENTEILLNEILSINNIDISNIISIIFTCTRDLDAVYPAVAARKIGIVNASLMCFDELYVEGSLPKCIRVMVNIDSTLEQSEMKHVYLKQAQKLRPDLKMK